jgi:hypothetical protein
MHGLNSFSVQDERMFRPGGFRLRQQALGLIPLPCRHGALGLHNKAAHL